MVPNQSGTKHDIGTVAIQNLLSNRILNTTRKTSPRARSENGVCDSFSLGSKSNDLLENSLTFFVNSTTRLKHYWSLTSRRQEHNAQFSGGGRKIRTVRDC